MTDIHGQRILIVDFGSQYTQLIARRVRESGVYCEIYPYDMDAALVIEFAPCGVILSGGPETVTAQETPRIPEFVFALKVPILGICYGLHALTQQLHGEMATSNHQEFGHACIEIAPGSQLLKGFGSTLNVWMSHGDKAVKVPEGFTVTAKSDNAPIAAIEDVQRRIYAVQFHPEVTHTEKGGEILARFVLDICGCEALWTASNIIEDAIATVHTQVGKGKVILGLSGGVDSSVVAAILSRAIGDQLECVFVDNGLLRKNEDQEIREAFGPTNALNLNLTVVDASAEFISKLKGVYEPEAKRKIIGATFIDVFERESARIEGVAWLAQGTIYPDVIESAAIRGGKAHVIKSHHNVGGLPDRMRLKLVEPLRELFKDEVRKIGLSLGLPEALINRHPFPGPGLGVRILGEVTKPKADILRAADAIFIEELRKADLYDRVSQAFTVHMGVNSVGVVGDARRYAPVIALRAVETIDFMTARWAHLPYEFIGRVANRIINEISGVSRVVYDVSSKPPATIEWE